MRISDWSSDVCSSDLVVGAEFVRSVEPGELVIVRDGQLTSHRPFAEQSARPCIFEYVYFSRPDSIVDGTSVYSVRTAIGAERARENPVDADLVPPVPHPAPPPALGSAQESDRTSAGMGKRGSEP